MAVYLGSGKFKLHIGNARLIAQVQGLLPPNILLSSDGYYMISSDGFYVLAKEEE